MSLNILLKILSLQQSSATMEKVWLAVQVSPYNKAIV